MRFPTFLMLGIALFFVAVPAGARGDAADALKQYAAAMASVHSYHMDMNTGKQATAMDIVLPDRIHIFSPDGGPEVIMIKPDVWLKMGDRWQKLPGGGMMNRGWAAQADSSRPPAEIDKNYTIADLGIKETYHAYRLTPKNGGEVLTLFLRPDSLPAKTVVTGKNGTTTTIYSNFNSVTIDPPK